MNKFSIVILLALIVACWMQPSFASTNLVGKWSGVDSDGDTVTFVFNEDKSAEVKLEGVPLLSSTTMKNGHVEWSGDTGRDPVFLDIVIFVGSRENHRIQMLARFIDEHTLQIQLSRDMTTRPAGFELSKEVFQVRLTKQ